MYVTWKIGVDDGTTLVTMLIANFVTYITVYKFPLSGTFYPNESGESERSRKWTVQSKVDGSGSKWTVLQEVDGSNVEKWTVLE